MPSNADGHNQCLLLRLPIEIRHRIYKHLFCHGQSPIWIGTEYYTVLDVLGGRARWPSEPTFHTPLFRVSRDIHLDTIRFAYSANDFLLRDNFLAFYNLGVHSLASIRSLTVIHTTWQAETEQEDRIWGTINNKCLNLVNLELELHADLLLQTVRHLKHFFCTLPEGQPRPALILDCFVMDRHFSFDSAPRDFNRAKLLLQGKNPRSSNGPRFTDPLTRVTRLPKHVQHIRFIADVSQGVINALDDYLALSEVDPLGKTSQPIPQYGPRAAGRSTRYWYVWNGAITTT